MQMALEIPHVRAMRTELLSNPNNSILSTSPIKSQKPLEKLPTKMQVSSFSMGHCRKMNHLSFQKVSLLFRQKGGIPKDPGDILKIALSMSLKSRSVHNDFEKHQRQT
jgi:hypothetical protein